MEMETPALPATGATPRRREMPLGAGAGTTARVATSVKLTTRTCDGSTLSSDANCAAMTATTLAAEAGEVPRSMAGVTGRPLLEATATAKESSTSGTGVVEGVTLAVGVTEGVAVSLAVMLGDGVGLSEAVVEGVAVRLAVLVVLWDGVAL